MSQEATTPQEPFPVLTERPLGAPVRKMWHTTRRDLAELPDQPPGTVLVFEADGRYQTVSRQRLTGTEPIVVESISVSLVSTRMRVIQVEIRLPSASPADDFTIRVSFQCQVVRPETVAHDGLRDLSDLLNTYLARDQALAAKCAAYLIDDIATVRETATAQITAYCKVRPPRVDGMAVELYRVDVFTPQELRDYTKSARDTKWQQTIEDLRRMGESEAVTYLTTMLRTPEGARALAVERGDLDTGQAAAQVSADRAEETKATLDLIRVMADNDHLDRVPLDIKYLFDSAVESLTGRHGTVGRPTAQVASDETRSSISAGQKDKGADARFIVDEDDLVN